MARNGLKMSFFSRKFWASVSSISDLIIYTYCLQIHIANLDGENETFSELIDIKEPKCQKRKYNSETTIIIRPESPECKKRKNNPEPEDEFTSLSSSLDDSSSACIDFSEIDISEFDKFDASEFDMWDCCNLFVIFSTIFTMFKLIIVPDG